MRFWDSSAIAPLLVEETASRPREAQLHEDAEILVWYGTWAELESAICRRERESSIDPEQAAMARTRLSVLTRAWLEVQPTSWVRERAIRLLRVHPLRAADAMQLAAALVAFKERTAGNRFLTADLRLAKAATLEGFAVE
jgi:predicted nucleic acid-binding protein